MYKIVGYGIFWTFVASLMLSIVSVVVAPFFTVFFIPMSALSGVYVFSGTLNLVQGVGFVYWVTRDTHRGFSLSIAFMRETDYPWRTGRGVQIGLGKYSFQLGVCRKNKTETETEGLMRAVKGRKLHYRPKEIREWL